MEEKKIDDLYEEYEKIYINNDCISLFKCHAIIYQRLVKTLISNNTINIYKFTKDGQNVYDDYYEDDLQDAIDGRSKHNLLSYCANLCENKKQECIKKKYESFIEKNDTEWENHVTPNLLIDYYKQNVKQFCDNTGKSQKVNYIYITIAHGGINDIMLPNFIIKDMERNKSN